jgi:hypothetical protein
MTAATSKPIRGQRATPSLRQIRDDPKHTFIVSITSMGVSRLIDMDTNWRDGSLTASTLKEKRVIDGLERRAAQIVGSPARYSHNDDIPCTVTTGVMGRKC